MVLKKIKSQRMISYLDENGIEPAKVKGNFYYYEETKQLNEILDRYYIQFEIMPNRL